MQKRSYYGLLSTISLSAFGDAFGLLAMEWLVYELTGSKLVMGALALSSMVPEQVLRLLGSPLSDRLPRVRFMACLAALRLLAILLPLGLGLAGHLQLWQLFAAASLSGACSALFMPTAMAVIPGVAGDGKLMRAFAVIDGCKGAAALLGPALAGVLTAASGALPALGINAVCYTAAILTLLYLPRMGSRPAAPAAGFSMSLYLREIAEGFSFYRQFPAMLMVMTMAAVSNLSSVAIWTMMVPYVREVLHRDAAAVGSLTTASALGYLIGLGAISIMSDIRQRRIVMLGSLGLSGVVTALWGFIPSYSFALFAVFAAGLMGPFFSSLSSALHGRLVPGHLQGRVNSVRFLIAGSLSPLGALAGGAVAELYGVPALLITAGMLPALYAGVALCLPVLKPLDGDLSELEQNPPKNGEVTLTAQIPV